MIRRLLITFCFLALLHGAATDARAQTSVAARAAAPVMVRVNIQHMFAGEALQVDNVALRTASNTVSISRVAYLISNVELSRATPLASAASSMAAIVDGAAFICPTLQQNSQQLGPRTTFDVDGVQEGEYASLSFDVGLSPAMNHANPAEFAATSPLNPVVNNLHWNWQGGYVFFALEGRWVQRDSSLGGYVYHIATADNLTRVTIPGMFLVKGDTELTISLDLAKVFDGEHSIALTDDSQTHSTHSAKGDRLARNMARNIAGAFVFVGAGAMEQRAAQAQEVVAAARGTTPYVMSWPTHFPQVSLPQDNPLTVEGVALGKRLFFDAQLSGNNAQSCASCHMPSRAFADNTRKATGAYGDVGERNTMPLFNLAWSQDAGYTWDGRKKRVRDQVLEPIENAREMGQSLTATIAKLQADETYPRDFARAFGEGEMTARTLSLAVEQYLLTLVSATSKFDRVQQGKDAFSSLEKQGFELFNMEYDPARGEFGADCFHCHAAPMFTNNQFQSNGLDAVETLLAEGKAFDDGRMGVTDRTIDEARFKAPSLRNVALTSPYMHDGRFETLMDVLAHYSDGVKPSASLDPNLAKHLRANEALAGQEHHAGVNLSAEQRRALEAFLLTLTDDGFVTTHSEQ